MKKGFINGKAIKKLHDKNRCKKKSETREPKGDIKWWQKKDTKPGGPQKNAKLSLINVSTRTFSGEYSDYFSPIAINKREMWSQDWKYKDDGFG